MGKRFFKKAYKKYKKRSFKKSNKKAIKTSYRICKKMIRNTFEKSTMQLNFNNTTNGAAAAALQWTNPTANAIGSYSCWYATDANVQVTVPTTGLQILTPGYLNTSSITCNQANPVNFTNSQPIYIKGHEYYRRSLRIRCKFVVGQWLTNTNTWDYANGLEDTGALIRGTFMVVQAKKGVDDADVTTYFQNNPPLYMRATNPTIVKVLKRTDFAYVNSLAPPTIDWKISRKVVGRKISLQTLGTGAVSTILSRGKIFIYFQYYTQLSEVNPNCVYHVFPYGYMTYRYMDP